MIRLRFQSKLLGLSKTALKIITIIFYGSALSCQWWYDSILGVCMPLNAPFRRSSSRQAVLDLYTGRHARMHAHTHTYICPQDWGNSSSQEFLGNFCSTSQANEISGDCGDRVAIVGIIQCGSSSSLHCLGWKVLSWRLVHWPAGVLLSSPCPRHGGMLAKKGMINWLQGKGCLLWPCLTREVALMVTWHTCPFDICTDGRLNVASFNCGQM